MMKIYNIKKRSNKYILELSNGLKLSLYTDTIIKYNLLKPKEINKEDLDNIINYNNYIECYNKALKLINMRLRTKKELYEKLNDYPQDLVDKVIVKLDNDGYLKEELYITSYITDAINHGTKGPTIIKQELVLKGLNKELIDKYLSEIEENIWINKASNLASKRVDNNKKLTNKLLVLNLNNYLMSKGYPKNIINIVVDTLELEDNSSQLLEVIYKKEYNRLKRKYNNEELETKLKYNLYKKGFSLSEISKYLNKD